MSPDRQPIADPARWLETHLGPGFSPVRRRVIADYPLILMRDFEGESQHCSLTALTSVFWCYAQRGLIWLPGRMTTLFYRIKSLARRRLINYPGLLVVRGGTIPFFLDRLAKAVWRFYGYRRGGAVNRLFWQSGRRAEQAVLAEIDAGRPMLLSLMSGYYRKHTVTVWGYEVWERPAGSAGDPAPERRVMLRVNDHWSDAPRYVDLYGLDPLYGGSPFEFCFLTPPEPLHRRSDDIGG